MENWIIIAATPAGGEGPVEQIVKTFGVNWPLFVSQCIAFLIVALALKKFAYAPVLKVLEDRKQRIAEGIENADKIKAELEATQAEKDRILKEAGEKRNEIIEAAKTSAVKLEKEEAEKALKKAEDIIAKAQEATEASRQEMMNELKAEIGRLVVETTMKVSGKVLTDEDQQRLIDETNKELAA
ncbi:MAG: ATP synthase F0 subunit B [Verrucomicrobiales bacterium]|nr:ATP synthase F0 subunit B [Verrucomicrobiales bacterium]|tara:strand:- start:173 stop:724 length:552 start_codon:yes stop_codon:yes gene_type:complete